MTKKKFEIISKAPARVCLFGDHQDYLNLPVIACAIDRFIEIKANKVVTDVITVLAKVSLMDKFEISLILIFVYLNKFSLIRS